jgi:hypothetical protein
MGRAWKVEGAPAPPWKRGERRLRMSWFDTDEPGDGGDSGEWDDPPGKLALLRPRAVAQLLRDGAEPFDPGQDRPAFARYLTNAGCQPPTGGVVPGRRRHR